MEQDAARTRSFRSAEDVSALFPCLVIASSAHSNMAARTAFISYSNQSFCNPYFFNSLFENCRLATAWTPRRP